MSKWELQSQGGSQSGSEAPVDETRQIAPTVRIKEPLTGKQRKQLAMAAHRAEWSTFFVQPEAGWTLH